jgi:hypothetical protein
MPQSAQVTRGALEPQEVEVSAGAQAGVAPGVTVRRDPAAVLALVGGGVLLVEAVLASLLFGFGDPSSSPLRTVLLLAVAALAACGAALLVRSALQSAAVLCLLATGLAAAAQLPFFIDRLHAYYALSFSNPAGLALGHAYAPLLAWIVAAAPLVCAAALALRRATRSRREHAG